MAGKGKITPAEYNRAGHISKAVIEDIAHWIKMAATYYVLPDYALVSPQEFFLKAEAAAKKAIELDSNNLEAYTILAMINQYDWEWKAAEEDLKRAITINPNYPLAHYWYGLLLSYRGNFSMAIKEIKKAIELDPLSIPAKETWE